MTVPQVRQEIHSTASQRHTSESAADTDGAVQGKGPAGAAARTPCEWSSEYGLGRLSCEYTGKRGVASTDGWRGQGWPSRAELRGRDSAASRLK